MKAIGSAMRIDLHYFGTRVGQMGIFLRLARLLQARGITLRKCGEAAPADPPDLRMIRVHGDTIEHARGRAVLDEPVPVVLVEHNDSVTTSCHASVKHANVLRVIRIATLAPHLVNQCVVRYHYQILLGRRLAAPSADQVLSPDEIRKLVHGPCYHAYDDMAPWNEGPPIDLDARREFEVQFAGRLEYSRARLVTDHRLNLYDRLRASPFRMALAPNTLSREDYNRILRNSQIVVSPYGHGEVCSRDAEAMYAGAVLVKPPAAHARTWPRYFEDGVTYVECKADWSDLHEVIQRVLDRWDDYRELRRANLERVRSTWDSSAIVEYCIQLLQGAPTA
jgi:hypothetical protein